MISLPAVPLPSPYTKYWQPRMKSQHIWKMPQSLNVQGISLVAVKNQNIFMISPAIQLAMTETRNPLHDLARWLERTCGIGRVASIERPITPILAEYKEYKEGIGARINSQMVSPMNR